MSGTKKVKKKKQYIVGRQDYINATTGEIVTCTVIEKKVQSDFNFHKIWLNDLMSVLDLIGGKKLEILKYLLSKMSNVDNTIVARYDDIMKELQVSRQTISSTLKILREANFIKKIANGVYMVNPDIIVKGTGGKKDALMIKYIKIDDKVKDEE